MNGLIEDISEYVSTGIGYLIGLLVGYYIFTSGWFILFTMGVYIIYVVLICYFKRRRLRWRNK